MGAERRAAPRVKATLPALWERSGVRGDGTISDISVSGCFMLSGEAPAPGEHVRAALTLPGGDTLTLTGEVVYNTQEIGFALRFVGDHDADKQRLAEFVAFKLAEAGAALESN